MSVDKRLSGAFVNVRNAPWGFFHDALSLAVTGDEWEDFMGRWGLADLARRAREGDLPTRQVREQLSEGEVKDLVVQQFKEGGGGVSGRLEGPRDVVSDAVGTAAGFVADNILVPIGRGVGRGIQTKQQQEAALQAELSEGAAGGLERLGVPEDVARGVSPTLAASAGSVDILDAFERYEDIYREAFAEPLATAAMAAGEVLDPEDGGIQRILESETWQDAYRRAQSTSPGQAAAATGYRWVGKLLPGVKTPNDRELAEWIGTPAGQVMSGTFDGVARFFTDPTVLTGKAIAAGRQAARPAIRNADDLAKVVASDAPEKFADEVAGLNAAEIRRTYFDKLSDVYGAEMSDLLASTPDRATRSRLVRAMLGDADELARLTADQPAISNRLNRLMGERDALESLGDSVPFFTPDAGVRIQNRASAIRQVEAEIDELYPIERRLSRIRTVSGAMRQIPDARTSAKVAQSEWYRESGMAAPLRTVFDMRPIAPDLNDLQETVIQVERQLLQGDKRVRGIFNRAKRLGHLGDEDVAVGISREERDELLTRLAGTSTREERKAVFMEVDDLLMGRMARAAGLTDQEADELVRELRKRLGAQDLQYNESMAFDVDGRGVKTFTDDRGVTHQMPMPLHTTQQVTNHFPLDVAEVAKALDPIFTTIRRYRTGRGLTDLSDVLTDSLDSFYSYWKFTRLARAGYLFGVLPDEQLRALEELGMMSFLGTHARRFKNLPSTMKNRLRGTAGTPAGQQPFRHGPYELEGFLGGVDEARSIMDQKISSRAAMGELVGSDDMSALRRNLTRDRPRMVTPDESVYPDQWEHIVNNQLAQSPPARMLMEGQPVDDVVRWLRRSPEGRQIVEVMDHRRHDLERWVEEIKSQVDAYVPDDGLQRLAAQRKAKFKDLNDVLPNVSDRPNIHGDFVEQLTGASPKARALGNATRRLGGAILSYPTDILSRHPFADGLYRREFKRLIDLADPQQLGTLDDKALAGMSEKARRFAANLTNERMYRIVERSDLAHAVRWVGPFFQAFQEVGNQWARAAARNPAFAARLRLAWYAPERMGWVTDRNGNPVEGPEEGDIIGELFNEMFGGDLDGKFINIKVPEEYNPLSDIPGARGLSEMLDAGFRWDKGSLSIATSFPFTGPIVSIPVAGLVGDKPEWDRIVRRFFPFGVAPSAVEEFTRQLLPPVGQQAGRILDPEDDRVELATKMRVYMDEVVRFNLDERDEYPTWAEVEEKANEFQMLHLFAKYFGRGSYQTLSPYQPIIDSYRQQRERFFDDPIAWREQTGLNHPVDWLIDEYGDEYVPLAQGLTDSIDGIPPTDGGAEAFEKYEDLVRRFPQWGGVIVGQVGGEFNRTFWEQQLREPAEDIGGAETRERRRNVLDEAGIRDAPMVEKGWREYRDLADMIDVQLNQRGLSNLQQSGASDLAEFRRAEIERIRDETTIPETGESPWFEAFDQRGSRIGRGEWLAGMHEIVGDERLAKRPEIQGLADYVELWDLIVTQLQSDERPQTLDAAGNRDLRGFFHDEVSRLVERNLPFSTVYYRMLEGREPEAQDATLLEDAREGSR